MRKISIIEITLVVDTHAEVRKAEKVLESKNISYAINGTDITIREQLTVEEYSQIVHQLENAL